MSKTWAYRLFNIGAIPNSYRDIIDQEGRLIADEGIRGSITLKNYRVPGRYSSWRRNWFSGSLVVTKLHVLCFAYSKTMIGLTWSEFGAKRVSIVVEKENKLYIEYDASLFSSEASGPIELRYSTTLAQDILR